MLSCVTYVQKGPGKCIPIKFASCTWVFHWKVGNQLQDMHNLGVCGLLAREVLCCWSERNICTARRNKVFSKPGRGTWRLYPSMSKSEMGAQHWKNDIWNCGNPRGKSTMQKASFPYGQRKHKPKKLRAGTRLLPKMWHILVSSFDLYRYTREKTEIAGWRSVKDRKIYEGVAWQIILWPPELHWGPNLYNIVFAASREFQSCRVVALNEMFNVDGSLYKRRAELSYRKQSSLWNLEVVYKLASPKSQGWSWCALHPQDNPTSKLTSGKTKASKHVVRYAPGQKSAQPWSATAKKAWLSGWLWLQTRTAVCVMNPG